MTIWFLIAIQWFLLLLVAALAELALRRQLRR
jgi:hypothetical protein